ncbi:MAG: hypothetical protein WD049_08965 [Candidatus Paceibacterota bacterium]
MDLLEIAQRLVGYDPATTPQKELADARRRAKEAEARYQNDKQLLSKLDDTVVYEWRQNDEHGYARPRTVTKQTAKQVRLAPHYDDQKQTYLSREQLEAGEFVSHGKGWWKPDFAYGWAIRPRLEDQLEESRELLLRGHVELHRIEEAIANGDIVLDRRMMDAVLAVYRSIDGPEPISVGSIKSFDWRAEGF